MKLLFLRLKPNIMRFIKNIFPVILLVFVLHSCNEEKFITEQGAGIRFSMDTLYFDTVFTQLSTVTRSFTIHNPHKDFVKISEMRLARGNSSVFRINVDGVSGTEFSDLEIAPRDSMYVFVEATLDPNNSDSILLQKDSVVTFTNGREQDIDIVAWGQDVHMFRRAEIKTQTWINDKPYLVIDYAIIDSTETLTLEPGVRVYFHKDAQLFVGGTMVARGTHEEPVTFKGDRFDPWYDDKPGLWGGIHFYVGSRDNILDHTHISNGIYGVWVDTVMNDNPTLTISNSTIAHQSSFGILAQGAKIKGYNNVITNCGSSAMYLTIGGSYEFYHTTVANYTRYSTRREPSVILKNYYIYNDTLPGGAVEKKVELRDIEKADFYNCIIYGGLENEIYIDEFPAEEGVLNYRFDHCLAKIHEPEFDTASTEHFSGMIYNKAPRFTSTGDYDFSLDTLSPAKDAGLMEAARLFPIDIKGDSRIEDKGPDLGAYERIE